MIVVDSSVWINHFRNDETLSVLTLRSIETPADIIVGDVVLLELLQGARDDRHATLMEDRLRAFTIVPMISNDVVREAASIYRTLRTEGVTIRKTIDLIIATYCIAGGHGLHQDDRDFLPISRRFGLILA